MRVEDVAELLRTKAGYLHFELNGEYYTIQSLTNIARMGDTLVFRLRKTYVVNNIGTLWNCFALELSDFSKYRVLLNANNRMYDFPSEITVRDNTLNDLEYIGKLNTVSTPKSTTCANLNTVSTPETVNYTTLNMLYERSSRYHGCDFNNAKIVTQKNGVEVELKPEHIHFNICMNENGEDDYRIVLDI